MKKWLALALLLALSLSLAACSVADDKINVFALKGPTGIGMVGVMENHPDAYNFTLAGAADEIVAAIASGSAVCRRRAARGIFCPVAGRSDSRRIIKHTNVRQAPSADPATTLKQALPGS